MAEASPVNFRDEFYSRLKGPTTGYCRICGDYADLTDDHVPPKAIFNDRSFDIRSYPYQGYKQPARAGLRIRSVCQRCNNEILLLAASISEHIRRTVLHVDV